MNIINEFFVSFILIKLYFKFKVCRKIKFPLLWKFYFSKWKFYFSADRSQKIAQTTKNLINKEIDIKVELLTKSMAIALGDLIKDVDDEKEKIKISLPQLKILDLKRIKADTFLSIKKQPSKPILLEKT
ncbi:hypothetical protein [Campylobacter coli]|uniref:hypothetical protein n=1 Tax=Campylobacter coli TaxID=195 RepID=UPI001CB77540|nr:hypothetical protein [Campylobacter coli]